MTIDMLRKWLTERVQEIRGSASVTVDAQERFSRLGLDSLAVTRLLLDLSTLLGRPLSPTLAWEYPTIEALASYLSGALGSETPATSIKRPHVASRHENEPIAVIGMACRFPKASDPASFFRMLCDGVDAITEAPKDRWDVDALFDADPSAPGKMSTRWGGFLDQVDQFDPHFFGISPREAMQMDPQQRLVLELSWEALESAGIPPRSLEESRTGVFVGAMWHDYSYIPEDRRSSMTPHSATGQDLSIIPARVSYSLGLRGPSIAFNTACSSSLAALHSARRSLQLGECDLALVGGVNLLLSAETMVAMSKLGAMAPDGRSKSFDSRANGYVRGEGGGVVVLKRLSAAIADGDPIVCVLLGSAINNDGASNGMTAPSPKAQELVLRDAYRDASVDPRDVFYVETHGTGTKLGDPIEAGAIGAVLGAGRPAERPILLGAVKTNVGHLEAAAGMAGLIKAALALKHGVVPPNLHFQAPNPLIDFDALHLKVPTSLEPWPAYKGRHVAGVSGFGFGGTNCHIVLGRDALVTPKLSRIRSTTRPVFVFAGQGSQWLRMGMDLLAEPAFRAEIERCDRAMRPYFEGSILDLLLSNDPDWLDDTAKVQPAIFAVQISLASLVRSLGVEPSAVVGQSIGEVAAAFVAGCLTLNDAALLICRWSQIVSRTSGAGVLYFVELSVQDAEAFLLEHGSAVAVATHLGPRSTVLSGETAAMAVLVTELERRGVICRQVKIDYAAHSRAMDPLLPVLAAALSDISPRNGSIPFYSTVTGGRLDGSELGPMYWCRNLAEPALFAETISSLVEAGHDAFLELDPHPLLVRSIESNLAENGIAGRVLPAMRRDEPGQTVLAESLAMLGAYETEPSTRASLLPLSAHTASALGEMAGRMAAVLQQDGDVSLSDVVYTAGVRRSHLAHRLSVVGSSKAEIASSLLAYSSGADLVPGLSVGVAPQSTPKVVFVFPGQGSQWLGMGRQLLAEEPAFREALLACDVAILREAGFSVQKELAADESSSRLAQIDIVQPVLFAVEVALAALWRSWGIEPSAVVGHSMGEVAAAYVAGILSLEDAVAVICRRSRLLQTVSGKGAMAMVDLPLADAERALLGYTDRLSVASNNGPRTTVIAGEPAALEEVLATLEGKEVFCRRVKVDVASHSPQMDPLLPALLDALSGLKPMPTKVPMRSTVTGAVLSGEELGAHYWAANLRQPVLFSQVTRECIEEGLTIFVEMSPHPILLTSLEENLRASEGQGAALASLRRQIDERQSLLESLGRLYTQGYPVDFARLSPHGGRVVELPTYPWQRERFWVESVSSDKSSARSHRQLGSIGDTHPLLGAPIVSSAHVGEQLWEHGISVQATPYLTDHKVQGEVVFPGAGYVEMALSAGREALGTAELTLSDLRFEQMLALAADGERIAQVVLTEQGAGCAFQISSRTNESKDWTKHARGNLSVRGDGAASTYSGETLSGRKARLGEGIAAATHYEQMRARQIDYGPAFQGISELWLGEGEVLGRVCLPESVDPRGYLVHPALLDACFQVTVGLLVSSSADVDPYVPVAIGRIALRGLPTREVWVVATKRPAQTTTQDNPAFDIFIVNGEGQVLVEIEDLRLQRLLSTAKDPLASCVHEVVWRRAERLRQTSLPQHGAWLLCVDQSGVGALLAEKLSAEGQTCVVVMAGSSYQRLSQDVFQIDTTEPEAYRRVLAEAFGEARPCQGVVYLFGLDAAPIEATTLFTLSADLERGCVAATFLTQAILGHGFQETPPLVLITRGAQAVLAGDVISVGQASLLGFAKTLTLEHPELRCTRIDLGASSIEQDAADLRLELSSKGEEEQVAFRGAERYVARLVRTSFAPEEGASSEVCLVPAGERPFQLLIREPGVLERLALHEMRPLLPGPGEVLIEVEAAGLNFRDVLLALGLLPDDTAGADASGPRLGFECAGTIVAVGEGVTAWSVGQEVIGLGARTFGSHILARTEHLAVKPSRFSWAEAATLPLVFMTAHYALGRIGRLRKRERVLIHAGAGGVGLAAIQLAMHIGAEIFATAGSEEKRSYLRSLGVPHVLDSRSLGFVEDIKRITQGAGVDVVLNSLSGEFIPASLSLLRDRGRFVEIGMRDYYEDKPLGLRPFLRSLSFSLVDLRGLLAQQPEEAAEVLQELMAMFEEGTLRPLPVQTFPASRAAEAFQFMAQAKHKGKIALLMKDPEARVVPLSAKRAFSIRADGTYLITGGLTGLGLSHAAWLVKEGARHLCLVGRRGASSEAKEQIALMEEAGAKVLVVSADVSSRDDMKNLFQVLDQQMPALSGILHAAVVLDDHTLQELSLETFKKVFAPKALGAWNLHALSEGRALDFFLMYSSVAALTGSPGQANYTAANAVLDALAHERERRGLRSMSIQWGGFSEIGLAAATDNRGSRLASRGIGSFTPSEGLLAMKRLFAHPRAEVGVVRFDVAKWAAFYPSVATSSFFKELLVANASNADASGAGAKDLLIALGHASHEEALTLLEGFLAREIGHVLRLDPTRIERGLSFHHLGVDSLMKLELRNRIRMGTGYEPSVVALGVHDDLRALASYLLEQLALKQLLERVQSPTEQPGADEADVEMETVTF